jgi:hypothetical protein
MICKVCDHLFRTRKGIFFTSEHSLYVIVCFGICVGQSSQFFCWSTKALQDTIRKAALSISNLYEAWDATAYRCSVWDRVTTQAHTEHLWLHVEKNWPLGDSIQAAGYITGSLFCCKLGFCISCC